MLTLPHHLRHRLVLAIETRKVGLSRWIHVPQTSSTTEGSSLPSTTEPISLLLQDLRGTCFQPHTSRNLSLSNHYWRDLSILHSGHCFTFPWSVGPDHKSPSPTKPSLSLSHCYWKTFVEHAFNLIPEKVFLCPAITQKISASYTVGTVSHSHRGAVRCVTNPESYQTIAETKSLVQSCAKISTKLCYLDQPNSRKLLKTF
jgi:hypothetical protein